MNETIIITILAVVSVFCVVRCFLFRKAAVSLLQYMVEKGYPLPSKNEVEGMAKWAVEDTLSRKDRQ